MARETKVGLLVGLCVILLIGIIVSDHLSVVQHQDPAQLTTMARTTQAGLTDQSQVPVTDANGTVAPPSRTQTVPGPTGGDATHPGQLFTPGQVIPPSVPNHIDPPQAPNVTVAAGQTPTMPGNPALALAPTTPTVQVLDTHVVKHGDTLFRLSKYYYHRGDLWEAIEKANPATVGPKGQLKDGSSLIIPVMAQANVSPTPHDAAQAPQQLHDTAGGINSPTASRMVQIRRNDTLAALATRYLGSRERWHEILAMNRDQLHVASDLRVGMTLRLPDVHSANTPTEPQPTAFARGSTPANGGVVTVSDHSYTTAGQRNAPVSMGNDGRPSTPWASVTNNANVRPAVQRVYTVQPSDSLQGIAAKTLGDPEQAQRIYDANRAALAGQTQLQIGQQLVIPAMAIR